jgi:hypothetical protein
MWAQPPFFSIELLHLGQFFVIFLTKASVASFSWTMVTVLAL